MLTNSMYQDLLINCLFLAYSCLAVYHRRTRDGSVGCKCRNSLSSCFIDHLIGQWAYELLMSFGIIVHVDCNKLLN